MRIALIHAVRVAMQPVEDAFRRHWPDAERVNLLDDALEGGAAGILYTCSAFGEAIEAVQRSSLRSRARPWISRRVSGPSRIRQCAYESVRRRIYCALCA